ncbi:fused MFS/spermidine synthase [Brachybacterium sp. EF45031]|uniref:spermidine synthase n=1 Tax=Brachybacterium sillae TaxID=2810536 RepID=UPI00217EB8C6|nr:fused MFS/spermidine synthase [Brachybacterium sillae]MCS6712390.1 fused MFS/spermidine synthase [Brachybacterium sillae]
MASRSRRARTASSSGSPADPPLGTAVPIASGTARLVPEADGGVLLEVNGVQSSYHHPDPEHLVFEYMRWMDTVARQLLPTPQDGDGLEMGHLGGGACTLARAFAAHWPGAKQTVVEIDGPLVDLVRSGLDLPRPPRMKVRVGDAAEVLRSWRDDRFTLLVRDVFSGDTTPQELRTSAAAAEARRVVRPGGTYLLNVASAPGTSVIAAELGALSEAFEHLAVIAEPAQLQGKRRGNVVIAAGDDPLPAGLDRALRADAVTVRLADQAVVAELTRRGRATLGL